jgi:hypothetical protein
MKEYTYSEARQRLAMLLREARVEGGVRIRRRDGTAFVVRPVPLDARSPLDVPGVRTAATMDDIVAAIRESRRSTERLLPKPRRVPRRPRKQPPKR